MVTLFVIQIILAVALIGAILIQKSGTDGLSGLSSGNMGGLVSARSKANFLSKITAIIAVLFMLNSMLLGGLVVRENNKKLVVEESTGTEKVQKNVTEEQVPIAD